MSWLVPVASGEKWLDRCLDSIVNQSYKNWEAIVIINGKVKDNEYRNLKSKYINSDFKFKFYELEKKGMANALNFGLKHCKGDWIARLDADDYSNQNRLEEQIKYTNYDLIFSNISSINENNEVIYSTRGFQRIYKNKLPFLKKLHNQTLKSLSKYPKKYDIRDEFMFRNPIPHSSVLVRKKVLTDIGGYISNKNGDNPCQDLKTWLKLIDEKIRIYQVDKILTFISTHPHQVTGSSKANYETFKIYLMLFFKYFDYRSLMSFIFQIIKVILKIFISKK